MTTEATPPSIADKVFGGALWFAALRLFSRLAGFLAFAIKARVLSPDDFGVIGSIALVAGFVGILGAHGVFDRLIRMPDMTEADVHRAWTLNLLFALGIAAATVASAAPAARFLNEPALADALRVVALRPIITALSSPIYIDWARALRFRPMVLFSMLTKLLEVVFSTAGAIMFRSYWGLIYGGLLAWACHVALTYVLKPYRPRLRLDGSAELLTFSTWSLTQAVANYFALNSDEIVVRRGSDTRSFGLYHVSRDLSRIFVLEAVAPVTEPLFAGLARMVQLGRGRFLDAATKAVAAAALVAASVGFGLSATAAEAVAIVLGAGWGGAVPILNVIALGVAALAVSELHRSITVAFGRIEVSTLLWVVRATVQLAACAAAFAAGGAMAVAIAFLATALVLLVVDYSVVFRLLGGRATTTFRVLWRPALAGAVMAGLLSALPWPPAWPVLGLALAKIGTGALAYGSVIVLAWLVAGRPQGGESVLLERLPARLRSPIVRLLGKPAPSEA